MEGDGEFLANGVWCWLSPALKRSSTPRAGLLLDRDGVLVHEVGYLHRPVDVRLHDGAARLIATANARNIPVAVVTNQAGIAREYFGWPEFLETQREIARQLALERAVVDAVIACPFHPDHTPEWSDDHAYWRKPGCGMLELAARELDLDPGRSWLVGDNSSDIAAARRAGLAGAVHIETGHGKEFRAQALELATDDFRVFGLPDIAEAIKIFQQYQ